MSDIFNINDYKKSVSGLTEKAADVRYINASGDIMNGKLYSKGLELYDGSNLVFSDGTTISSKNDIIPQNVAFSYDGFSTNTTNTNIQINGKCGISTNLGPGNNESFKITDTLTNNRMLLLPRSGWASYNPISDGDDMTLCYYPDTIDYVKAFNITRWSFTKLGLKFFEKKLDICGGNSKITMNGINNKVEINAFELSVGCDINTDSIVKSKGFELKEGVLKFADGTQIASKSELGGITSIVYDAITDTNSTTSNFKISNNTLIETNKGIGSNISFAISDTGIFNRLLFLARSGWGSYNTTVEGNDFSMIYQPQTADYAKCFTISRWSITNLGIKLYHNMIDILAGIASIRVNGSNNKIEINATELSIGCNVVTSNNIQCNNVIANTINGYNMSQLVNPIGDGLPVGTIIQGLWKGPVSKYLVCEGQRISRIQYPELFSVIGYDYGVMYDKYINNFSFNPEIGVYQDLAESMFFYLPDLRASYLRNAGISSINPDSYRANENQRMFSPFGYDIDRIRTHTHRHQFGVGTIRTSSSQYGSTVRDNDNDIAYTSSTLYTNTNGDSFKYQGSETTPFYHTVRFMIKALP